MIDNVVKAKTATKTMFLVCGLGIASWAPMVPYAKQRLNLDDANLGLLLLMLGCGAITMMPVSGYLGHKYGNRIVILCATLLMALTLPLLLILNTAIAMGVALFVFGAAVGTVDVAMNSHGVQVQNLYGKPIMSSLHGLFSVGGLFGSLGLGFLMKFGLEPITAAVSIAILLILIVSFQYRFLFDAATEKAAIANFSSEKETGAKSFSWLKKSVVFLGIMCFIVFLSEGAMLDWSALFLHENRGVNEAFTGMGYATFSIAMATMRLIGDKIVSRFNSKVVVVAGSLIAASGLFLAVLTPWTITALIGFILLGLGAANIVPVFLSEAGRLKNISAAVAIPAITTMGYAGQLAGPALLGLLAQFFSLPIALGCCGIFLVLVAAAYKWRKQE
ncbi:MFS transporter [Flavobacterium aquidurense]|jgi:predicted MFS family arabinose efflux permease|uniref:MFS transporter n=1 Tax=Flavobacterium aquidurense TaxID=362413 RepID=UPI000923460C|nr:MFS transporter [Flavobacterium aquidurense]OXA74037.1 MFS transporter [Flavobacterium aquidurense]SHG57228.1 Fucose permease [Flavobacterium frigidimaris]